MTKGIEVFLLDDDPEIFELISHELGELVQEFCYCRTYSEATEKIEERVASDLRLPDLYFVDLDLKSDKTGHHFIEKLRKSVGACPVIVLSGSDSEDNIRRSAELGALDHKLKDQFVDDPKSIVRTYIHALSYFQRVEQERAQEQETRISVIRQIAHDIGNLLAPYRLRLEVIERAIRHDHPRNQVFELLSGAKRLIGDGNYLVRRLADYNYSTMDYCEMEAISVEKEIVRIIQDLRDLVDECAHNFGAGDTVVDIDPSHLRRIVRILVENVHRHGRSQDGVARLRVTGFARPGSEHFIIRFEDEGRGVPAELAELIFVEGALLDRLGAEGTGIGLATAYRLARQLENVNGVRGGLRLDDTHSTGARFDLALPLHAGK